MLCYIYQLVANYSLFLDSLLSAGLLHLCCTSLSVQTSLYPNEDGQSCLCKLARRGCDVLGLYVTISWEISEQLAEVCDTLKEGEKQLKVFTSFGDNTQLLLCE